MRNHSGARLLLMLAISLGYSAAQSTVKAAPPGKLPVFTEVAAKVGLNFKHEASPTAQKYLPETMGAGVALFDYNNDGRPDVFFTNGAPIRDPMPAGKLPVKDSAKYWDRLFEQQADGTFRDVTEKAGVGGVGKPYSMGVATGDYDNDGDTDLYVTGFGSNTLYRNGGDGKFTDVTQHAGVAGDGWSTSAAFVDYDHDGLLDIFVARYLVWTFETNNYCGERALNRRAYCHPDLYKGVSALLFRNQGNGKFEEVSAKAGVANPEGKSLGVAVADANGDGLIDIYVANDSVRQFLYINNGNGKLEDVALAAGAALDGEGGTYAGMGVDFADYDNDLRPDVFVTNLSNQRYALYHNEGDGTYEYVTGVTGVGKITLLNSGWGTRFLDYDNDGWKDLLVAQSHVLDTVHLSMPHVAYKQAPLLMRNMGGRAFKDEVQTAGELFKVPMAARGLAIGDVDNDGDMDAVLTTTNGPAYLLRNDGGNRGNWLQVTLRGHQSNRDGQGATVTIIGETRMRQAATVTTASSYQSASDKRLHFGLGSEKQVKQVQVRWPSGVVQTIEAVRANQHLNIEEPPAGARNVKEEMVGTSGLEPETSTVSR